eukprot:3973110-Prymnesium_polylepis.1
MPICGPTRTPVRGEVPAHIGTASEASRGTVSRGGLKAAKVHSAAKALWHHKWGLSCESDPLTPG